jgi:hypothetical protein
MAACSVFLKRSKKVSDAVCVLRRNGREDKEKVGKIVETKSCRTFGHCKDISFRKKIIYVKLA